MSRTRQESNKIYIVEDEGSVRRALDRLLRSAGLNSETYESGEEFLRRIPKGVRGCVIVDIRMPGLTGHDIMERLRAAGEMIPMIALSAQDDAETRERARQLGAAVFFRKPVDDQALLDAIQWLLDAQKPAHS